MSANGLDRSNGPNNLPKRNFEAERAEEYPETAGVENRGVNLEMEGGPVLACRWEVSQLRRLNW